ncbi:MAG TPA: imidazole glycerol phosphate synthase subunit HisH [Oscillospiraceae bacterium]|nr:imidazole glycerol phosphate synthase subunit HisH [Oscillospiraceae bacterium]HPF56376.1 imidazole glycerol phosphate synthase subunit HisH [Clostridiales bacterium]HPK35448.1 imidazole glycerol phosphate synthase subunit HisH [Oscillospiraceae bacterium]HPR75172.1 imidazole glycerol phosphate synthase subunit HisH [Oscillospiraceae bacterium]
MTAIVDYGVGNLFGLAAGFEAVGEECKVTGDFLEIAAADRIVLPGVGAFGDAAQKLADSGLVGVIKDEALAGKPLLGICLGMQLLFVRSYEYGLHYGLGLLGGSVKPFADVPGFSLKIPQIGWNSLEVRRSEDPLMKYTKDGDFVYFVHSYYADECDPDITATTEYGVHVPAVVSRKNIFGCQFHPEKSGEVGLRILKAFCEVEA